MLRRNLVAPIRGMRPQPLLAGSPVTVLPSVTPTTARRHFSLGSKPDDGHPLPEGSRLDLFHKWCRKHINQGQVFHLGKCLSVFTVVTQDWVVLRTMMAVASICSMVFHFVFPSPRPARIAYGFFFFVGHLSALAWFLYSKSDWIWPIDDPEFEAIYEKSFKPFGVSKYEFRQFCGGEFVSGQENGVDRKGADGRTLARIEKYNQGDTIVHQGNDMRSIWLVIEGHGYFMRQADQTDRPLYDKAGKSAWGSSVSTEEQAAVVEKMFKRASSEPMKISTLAEGSWVGEVFDKNYDWNVPHKWRVSFVSDSPGGCTVLRIPKRQFHDFIIDNPHCENSCHMLQLKDLWIARRLQSLNSVVHKMKVEEMTNRIEHLEAQLKKQ